MQGVGLPLTRKRVLDEAMRLADDDGLDALTLRSLASRLGVQAPTLYWHVHNKAELLDALGDAVMDDVLGAIANPGPDTDWRDWLLGALMQFRRAMLAHTNGARIVSGARGSLRRADFSEYAMATLVNQEVTLQRARMTVLVAERYTVGHVLEEQASAPDAGAPDMNPTELERRLPTVTRAINEFFTAGGTSDDIYRDGARLILGLAST